MSSSDVSAVTSHFASPNEGFSTTSSAPVSSGATTVGLTGTTGLTNADVFVGIIEPSSTKEQVFTGIVDTGGSQITGVKWTKGTNVDHATGVTIVDYVTGTGPKMMTKGLLVEHAQAGTHTAALVTSRTEDTTPADGDYVLTYDTSASALKKVSRTNFFLNPPLGGASVDPDTLNTGAAKATVATSQSTARTSYTDLATVGPAVTVTIGANGLALVCLSSQLSNDTGNQSAYMELALSGASTAAASDTNRLQYQAHTATAVGRASSVFILTGLTAGSTTFTAKYRASANTATFSDRNISVVPL